MVDNLADLSVLPVFAMEPGMTVESVEPEKTAVLTESAGQTAVVLTENEEHSRENTLEAGKTAEDSAGETSGTGAGIFFLLWKKRNGDEEE